MWQRGAALLSGLLAGCATPAAGERVPSTIYGADDRKEYFEVSASMQRLADSTVAIFDTAKLGSPSGGRYRLPATTLQDVFKTCGDEPFAQQPSSAFCSGILVAPDLILTAGHCIRDAAACAASRFVFSYAVKGAGQVPAVVPEAEVYACAKLVNSKTDMITDDNPTASGVDMALVRLDRAVVGHQPVPVRRSGAPGMGDRLAIVGYPFGLPVKVAVGGRVLRLSNHAFIASLDAGSGSSGAPVFNEETNLLEGVLSFGHPHDFMTRGNCRISLRCPEGGGNCMGETVIRTQRILEQVSWPEVPALN